MQPPYTQLMKEAPGPIGSTGFGEQMPPGFSGPGGQAPPFAPGGPENPYPVSAGMPPPNAMSPSSPQGDEYPASYYQAGDIPQITSPRDIAAATGTPGHYPVLPRMQATGGAGGGNVPNAPGNVPPSLSQQAGYPPVPIQQGIPGLPGHGTTPGEFQPGGGVRMPQPMPPKQPTASPRSTEGFMARIIPIEAGSPVQPLPPTPPGGTNPPSVGIPGFPTPPIVIPPPVPGQPLPPIPPDMGGGATTGKPRGLKILPMPTDDTPPADPPKPPGQWVTLDAGKGQPPAWGFLTQEEAGGEDTGLEPSPKKTKGGGQTSSTSTSISSGKPSGGGSGSGEQAGHYVPVQLPYVVSPASDESPDSATVWCWVPEIGADYGVKEKPPEPETPQPKK